MANTLANTWGDRCDFGFRANTRSLHDVYRTQKIAAYIQDRVGPNRVGPFGLFQAIADGIKIFLKEQVIPDHVYTFLYFIAPTFSLMTAMFALVVMPFGPVKWNMNRVSDTSLHPVSTSASL